MIVFWGSLGKILLKQNVKLLPQIKLEHLFQLSIAMVEITCNSCPSMVYTISNIIWKAGEYSLCVQTDLCSNTGTSSHYLCGLGTGGLTIQFPPLSSGDKNATLGKYFMKKTLKAPSSVHVQ